MTTVFEYVENDWTKRDLIGELKMMEFLDESIRTEYLVLSLKLEKEHQDELKKKDTEIERIKSLLEKKGISHASRKYCVYCGSTSPIDFKICGTCGSKFK